MKTSHWVCGTVSVLLLSFTAIIAEEVDLKGVKCVMNPKADAKAAKTVDYKGGKVYFCCDMCPKAFAKDPAKNAVAANMQLVATKQAKQEMCPISGAKIDATKTAKVGDIEVSFCCEKCQGKVKAADAKGAAELVFSDAAFDKGFKVTAKK